ncbi:hypothetical protein JCM16814_08010 [Desulfobaculum senezii]
MLKRALVLLALVAFTVLAGCDDYSPQNPLTPEERQWIKDHKNDITIGTSLHFPPYEEFDLEGTYSGLSADYIKLISKKVGLDFKPVRFRNREELLRRIKAGDIDIIAAIEMTEERQQYLDFTQSYVSVPAAIITRKEFTDDLTLDKLGGMRIGVTVSPDFTKYLKTRLKVDCEVVPVAGGYIGGLRSLAVGDIDALICDMALASHYIANARISNLRIAGLTNYSIELRMASRKNMQMLNSILRKGFALILPHERKAIEEKWLSLQYEPFWMSRTFWLGMLAAVGVVIGGICLILVWNRSLKRQVALRTAALSSINKVLLGSLECHTEREVMRRCLDEAMGLSGSDYAAWGEVHADGSILELLGVASHDASEEHATLFLSTRLDETQVRDLARGRVIQALCTDEAGKAHLHVVAVPLQGDHDAKPQIIAATRMRQAHTQSEVTLLAEMLFAFEEALQRKRTEISLHEKERQLQRVQRMEALGTLAGGIAHDFNNILGVIIANGELVEMFHAGDDETLKNKIRSILTAADRGRNLVSQILSFARKGGDEVALLTISPIVKETVKFLEASLPASIAIDYTIQSPEPPVLAEPTQIHQVLMNLCTNAAHAMHAEGGRLSITLGAVHRRMTGGPEGNTLPPGRYLAIEVADTGTGISPEKLERIFEPFYTTKTPSEGTGLGLAVVDGIVKSWGGTVLVDSTLGTGSTFTVLLPAQEFAEEVQPAHEKPSLPCGTGRILFVDDEHDLTESYTSLLTRLGYRVHAATESRAALGDFRRDPASFDLVITDYNMPDLRGDKLAGEILAIRPDVPIILCTGYSHSFNEHDAARLGIQEYLKKPVSLQDLAVTVRKYLRPQTEDGQQA